jgi:glycosyltransferase involved in cell wall biosynthesis
MISVIIPALNESQPELNATVRSIRNTSEEQVEIIIVDDCSSIPVPAEDYIVRNLKHRVGGGAARHIGALQAGGDILVFTDSHCRFTPGWVKAVTHSLRPGAPRLLCGQMLALEATDELPNHRGAYWGGKLVLHDPTEKENRRILASKWRGGPPQAIQPHRMIPFTQEITACMGACYAIDRDFFFRIGGMSLLNGFGSEEEFLSMKTMLAGGDIIFVRDFQVGHRFRPKATRLPYRLELWEKYFNTLVTAHVCCPASIAEHLIGTLGLNVDIQRARDAVKAHWHVIDAEATRLKESVYNLDWQQYTARLKSIDG